MWQPETMHCYHVDCWNAATGRATAAPAQPAAPAARPVRRATPRPAENPFTPMNAETPRVQRTEEDYQDEERTLVAHTEENFPLRFHLVGTSLRGCPKVGDLRVIDGRQVVIRATRPEYFAHGNDTYGLTRRGWVYHLGCEGA